MNTDVKHEELNHINYLGSDGQLLKATVCTNPEFLDTLSYPVVPSYDADKSPCKECSWILLASNAALFRKEAAVPSQVFYLNDSNHISASRHPWTYYAWMVVAVLAAVAVVCFLL